MPHVVNIIPDAMKALIALGKSAGNGRVPSRTIRLVQLRASQINGCSVCVDMHWREMKQASETEERLMTLPAWRDTLHVTAEERAALALAEAVTRLSDRPDPVPDEVWNEAARLYDEPALAALLVGIATINVWNRLNAATRQIAFGSLPQETGQVA
jgi:AhpD family alkylhydroperoxidase